MRILMYHQVVDGTPREVHGVSLRQFTRQMVWLAEAGYRAVSLRDRLAQREPSQASTQERTVVITFDDGYQDNYTNALPLLLQHAFTATVFLVTDAVGQASHWREGPLGAAPMLTWAQVRQMATLGLEFGSHTVSHPRLPLLDVDSVRRELSASRQRIEGEIGCPVTSMAYPYSAFTPQTRAIVSECGYHLACTYRPGYVGAAGGDPLALDRIGILATDDLKTFKRKVRGSLDMRLAWRRRLLSARVRRLLESQRERP